jgi:hypothetical protein
LISHSGRVLWAEYLQVTSSTSYLSEWGKRGPKDFIVTKSQHCREGLLTPFTSERPTVKLETFSSLVAHQGSVLFRVLTNFHHAASLQRFRMCSFPF